MTMPTNPLSYEQFYHNLLGALANSSQDAFTLPIGDKKKAEKMRLRYYSFVRVSTSHYEARLSNPKTIPELKAIAADKLDMITRSRRFKLQLTSEGDIKAQDRDVEDRALTDMLANIMMTSPPSTITTIKPTDTMPDGESFYENLLGGTEKTMPASIPTNPMEE